MGAMILFNQYQVSPGDNNSCGSTSLAMVLANAQHIPATLQAAQAIDRSMRTRRCFSTPDRLVACAKSFGLNANHGNYCTFFNLMEAIKTSPTIVMINNHGTPHYEVVLSCNGYELQIADPAMGAIKTQSVADFLDEWKCAYSIFGMSYRYFMINFNNKQYGKIPKRINALADLISGVMRIFNGPA